MPTIPPCATNPDLFFGGHIESNPDRCGGPSLDMTSRAAAQSARARTECLLRCPLAQLRSCAQTALDTDAAYGVWAGVQLPGGQTRKIKALAAQRELLAGIASGEINPYTHPSNRELLTGAQELTLFPAPRPAAARRLQHAVSA